MAYFSDDLVLRSVVISEAISGEKYDFYTVQAGLVHVKKNSIFSTANNVQRRFFDSSEGLPFEILHTSSVCALLMLAKISPDFFFLFFSPDFSSQLRHFGKCGPPYEPKCFWRRKKRRKNPAGQASWWACRTRVQNFRGSDLSLKNGVDIWTVVRKNE